MFFANVHGLINMFFSDNFEKVSLLEVTAGTAYKTGQIFYMVCKTGQHRLMLLDSGPQMNL